METMALDGKTAHHGGDVCVMCVLLAKSLPGVSFSVPTGTHLAVKLLHSNPLLIRCHTLTTQLSRETMTMSYLPLQKGKILQQKKKNTLCLHQVIPYNLHGCSHNLFDNYDIYNVFTSLTCVIWCLCKYPNAQFTSTGNGWPISSNGAITGIEKSHFRYCVYRSFF
jgi:hypothetical protein